MTNADLLPACVLRRKAVVSVRQSSPAQVHSNLESQRRQYELVEVARRHGFHEVAVIDDDLGRSAGGTMVRPGFERLVASLCAGEVGAVLCLDASRLARNGRDWHHLLELCGLVEARVIDLDGVYDPVRPNDRLLLEPVLNLCHDLDDPGEHETGKSNEVETCKSFGQSLVVSGQPAEAGCPGEEPFDHPPARQEDEAFARFR
jgi:hypothetical protein